MDLSRWKGFRLEIEARDFEVASVQDRPRTETEPAFLLLEARASPALRVDLALPQTWNGRLLVVGNGGYAGEPVDSLHRDGPRAAALAKGFAVAGSNGGHDAKIEPLGTFAANPEKVLDYAHRAVHQTLLVAKALIAQIYGHEPRFSYFEGCSTGGRQALMSAQRHPADFDGIICGAPVFDFTGTQLWALRTAQMLQDADIGAPQMRLVADAIARIYGTKSDLLGELQADPLGERFDVRRDVPLSDSGQHGLTRGQLDALAAVYAPVEMGAGRTFPGQPIGAEPVGSVMPDLPPASGWQGWYFPWEEGMFATAPDGVRASFGESFLQHFLGVASTWRDFDFASASLSKLPEVSALLDATDPDLGAFASRGGKLIMYHGQADAALNPARTIAYFEEVKAVMGPDAVAEFLRFYLAPGVFHCSGGYGPDRVDLLTPLVNWVESREAPGAIVATQMSPIDPEKAVASRPLCPYPQVARYDGKGDPGSADSFICTAPSNF